ncbi:MAG: ABC transporter transmembrane domain-containing protein, partial [Lachnospiraceae bacterium]
MIRSLYRIFKRLGGLVTYVFLLVLRCPVDTVLCIINAIFTKGVFQAMEAGDLAGLQESCLKFVIANFCLFFYNGIVWSEFAMFSARFVGKLRSFVFDSMFLLPLEKIEEKTNGAWLTRMNSDVRMTLNLLTGAVNIPHAVFAIVRITVSSILLGTICPELLVAELATLLPHVFLRQNLVVRPMERLIKKAQEHTEQTMVYLSAMVECADTV